MFPCFRLVRRGILGVLLLAVGLSADLSVAQVTAPSIYTTAITVQGEEPGTEFDDWDGIPIATMDPADNVGFVDIADIQVANDSEYLYVHITYHDDQSLGTFLGFDLDQDVFTGFDIFSLGLIGTELGYVNDFPFEQAAGVFNTGDNLSGGPFGNGGALIFPFWNEGGPQKELAIPLNVGFTNPAEPAFVNPTFDFMVYFDQGLGDITEVITYTLADPPMGPSGDFNDDGAWDCSDINSLSAAVAAGSGNLDFDMNSDGAVTAADITDADTGWLTIGGLNNPDQTGGNPFLAGDANLDGSVDVSDFNNWNSSKFTDTPAWCAGDFNANGVVDVSDFNIWNANKFQSSRLMVAVPEPASSLLAALFLAAVAVLRRSHADARSHSNV